ncbi:MAG: polyribonucleotide nucleotidyltransferase [Thermomicrobiales bacterium]
MQTTSDSSTISSDNLPVIHEERVTVGGREMIFEVGRIAEQAGGAVTVRYGDTLILSTATASKQPREGIDFFPLTVDYEERMSAAGKIPGGFLKREGRPGEHAILSARLTDRPIRPLFPKGYRNDVHIVTTVFSTDQQNDPDILSITGASAALTLSSIPFKGPVAGVRLGYVEGQIVVNPTYEDLENSEMNVVVAGTRDAIMMVEGEALEVSEDVFVDAIELGHRIIKMLVDAQLRLAEAVQVEKEEVEIPGRDPGVDRAVQAFLGDRLTEAMQMDDKAARSEAMSSLKDETVKFFVEEFESNRNAEIRELQSTNTLEMTEALIDLDKEVSGVRKAVADAYEDFVKETMRRLILEDGYRADGRTPEEIRPIWCQVGYLPRTHGSAIFTRGQTQVVSTATLGSTRDDQMVDNLTLETSKRYLHHYNFPPYSVGEARFMRGPSRRDIGHGALAERALEAVLPDQEEFPYVMRVVSEVVSSNGSTSMASVCGSTLSLMDAGVPISAPVAGIAMGLITDGQGGYTILSDIQGLEDFLGDMDFKVAGTRDGITAIQMDIKVAGITTQIMREALAQARDGRMHILDKMIEVMPTPREEQSQYAPSIQSVSINPEFIGMVIGPGGKNIRAIQEDTETEIDIQEDGTIFVAGVNSAGVKEAIARIEKMTWEPSVGDVLTGEVKTIIPVGAFVELTPGRDGFVHISELSEDRVNKVEDVVRVGDMVEVKVTEIRNDGKINLTMRGQQNVAREPVKLPEEGEIVSGPVKNIIQIGAFVEVAPGRDGFVHISNLTEGRVNEVRDILSVGDVVNVRVTKIRDDGKIDLTMRGVSQDGDIGAGEFDEEESFAPRSRRPGYIDD